jgi:hypothetical protein
MVRNRVKMGNSASTSSGKTTAFLEEFDVQIQITTVYGISQVLVESLAWKKAKIKLANKRLSVLILDENCESYTMRTDERFVVVSENLPQRIVGLRYTEDNIVTLAQLRFPTVLSFLLWFQSFHKSRRPLWESEQTRLCKICKNSFSWRRRQHHCRNCGKAVCSACSQNVADLSQLGYSQPQRICAHCARTLCTKSFRPKSVHPDHRSSMDRNSIVTDPKLSHSQEIGTYKHRSQSP